MIAGEFHRSKEESKKKAAYLAVLELYKSDKLTKHLRPKNTNLDR